MDTRYRIQYGLFPLVQIQTTSQSKIKNNQKFESLLVKYLEKKIKQTPQAIRSIKNRRKRIKSFLTILIMDMKLKLVHLAPEKLVLQTYASSPHRSFVKKELLQVDAHHRIGVLEWVYATHVVMLVIVVKRKAKWKLILR